MNVLWNSVIYIPLSISISFAKTAVLGDL